MVGQSSFFGSKIICVLINSKISKILISFSILYNYYCYCYCRNRNRSGCCHAAATAILCHGYLFFLQKAKHTPPLWMVFPVSTSLTLHLYALTGLPLLARYMCVQVKNILKKHGFTRMIRLALDSKKK